jgi:prepilin-type N-terminal cleavage/methylation domain-containing protein
MEKQSSQAIKRSFTLVEILIVIAILSLVGGGIGYQISRLINDHCFQSEAAAICSALQEAQFISVIHETECELLIYPEKGHLVYQLKTDEPLPAIDQRPKPLKESRFITLNNAKAAHVCFKVLSSGRIEPTAVLGFHQKDPVEHQFQGLWLDLQTPVQIKLMHEKPILKRFEIWGLDQREHSRDWIDPNVARIE